MLDSIIILLKRLHSIHKCLSDVSKILKFNTRQKMPFNKYIYCVHLTGRAGDDQLRANHLAIACYKLFCYGRQNFQLSYNSRYRQNEYISSDRLPYIHFKNIFCFSLHESFVIKYPCNLSKKHICKTNYTCHCILQILWCKVSTQ